MSQSVQIQQRRSNQQSFIITTALFAALLITLLFIKLQHPPIEIPIEAVIIDFGDGNEGAASDNTNQGGGQASVQQASTPSAASTPVKATSSSSTMTAEDVNAIALQKMQKAEAEAKAKEDKRLADIIKKAEAERLAGEAEEKRIKEQMTGIFGKGKAGQGNGNNGNGQGTGSGNGNGPGTGPGGNGSGNNGSGVGTGLNVSGRGWRDRKQPFNSTNKEGKVVVAIKVDKAGNIIYAKGGYTGSTTTDPYLVGLAEKAALSSKLTASDASSEEQFGTIVYNFRNTQ